MIMISICLGLFLAGAACCVCCALERRWRWLLLMISMVAINAVSLSWQIRIARIDHLRAASAAECAGVPEVVPYRDGMTLCPGQSAVVVVPVPLGPEPDRGI